MTKGQPIDTHIQLDREPELNKFFKAAIKTKASDLHLKVGQPLKLRVFGDLKNTTGEIMTAEKIEQLVFELLSPPQKEFFLEHGTIDFAYEIGSEDRFRINIFRQRGFISLAARRVNSKVPPFEELHLPKTVLEKISDTSQGLVLVVGPTGCGKSTTIAAMIDYINRTRPCHIITIEDPIEYTFKDAKSIVSQREIGIDVKDYEVALRYMMREDPDVVMIGEMRDSETIKAGMRSAETGHLVFGTLHATNASQTIQRMLDLFPQAERDLVRQTLSLTLKAVVSQLLLSSIKEGIDRIPAVEILLANPSVKKLISEGRENDLPSVIRASEKEGMLDFITSLCSLVQNGFVDPKEAYQFAPNAEELKMALKGIRTSTSGIL
jgi:twitching motility protein PilT